MEVLELIFVMGKNNCLTAIIDFDYFIKTFDLYLLRNKNFYFFLYEELKRNVFPIEKRNHVITEV